MAFITNYDDVQDYSLIPVGEYEVNIEEIEERTSMYGSVSLSLTLVIRDDVEQNCKKRRFFHNIWKRKEPTPADLQVQGYGFSQVMQLAKSAGLTNGKEYADVYALCADIKGKNVRVKVAHKEYNGRTYENIKSISATLFPNVKPSVSVGEQVFEEILSDSDVPF